MYDSYIRDVKNFPQKGIAFKDISPLLASPKIFKKAVVDLAEKLPPHQALLGIESRGFIFSSALSLLTEKPLYLIRKKGKLPPPVWIQSYQLEYGNDQLELSQTISSGLAVVIIDDVLATGGTLDASIKLAESIPLDVKATATLLDLKYLHEERDCDICHVSLIEYGRE